MSLRVLWVGAGPDLKDSLDYAFGHDAELKPLSLQDARAQLAASGADLILLDEGELLETRVQFCAEVRASKLYSHLPIIVMSSSNLIGDKLAAFEAGANDYIVRPFDVRELRARARVHLRIFSATKFAVDVFRIGPIVFYSQSNRASVLTNNVEVDLRLTPIEFRLLVFLAQRRGQAFPKEALMQSLWGRAVHVGQDTLYTHMSTLRKKLSRHSATIKKMPGSGYVFEATEAVD